MGGRSSAVSSGYRPQHKVLDDYQTTGIHDYLGRAQVLPGETVKGTITFITPEAYPKCLWIGRIIEIQEGSRIIGQAKITKIMNPLLERGGDGKG